MKKKNKRLLKELNQKILIYDRLNDRLEANIKDLSHRVSQCEYDIVTIQDCIRKLREDSTLAEIWSDK